MLKKFIPYYKPYLKTFIFVMFCDFLISIISMSYPILTRTMINDLIPNKKFNLIIIFGVSLLVLYIIKAILKYFFDYYGHMVGTGIQKDMRAKLFAKLEKLPFTYYDNNETGKVMARMTSDLFDIAELAHHGPENLFMAVIMIGFSFVYLAGISLSLTLIIYACVPVLVITTSKVRKLHMVSSKKAKAAQSIISSKLNSSISGIRVTKAFNNSDIESEKFSKGNDEFVEAKKGQYKTMSFLHSTTTFITELFNVVCLISGGIFLYKGLISFGDYTAFMLSINVFITPVLTLVNFTEVLHDGMSGFERYLEIMAEEEEKDYPGAKEVEDLNGDIVFNKVGFHYNDSKEVLKEVSFTIPKSKTVALVGPSGGGKTTICHLIPGFYEPTSGSITINGHDIKQIKKNSLRDNIGIVEQDVFLFSGTFYENILYGKKDATFKEVVQASKKANIYDYIMSLPEGFDTQIGERGIKLSGGQKQRLSIARVFLKNPDILILDEATSALDNTTEVLIQESLNSLKEGRTTLVVAHRLSTVKNADEILVVSDGDIIERGNHTSLIKADGVYKNLYNSQFKEEKPCDMLKIG